MSCTTAVKYDVREDILRNWLEAIFGVGETETGLIIWSCTVSPSLSPEEQGELSMLNERLS